MKSQLNPRFPHPWSSQGPIQLEDAAIDPKRLRLWNSCFAQQILAQLLDPQERSVFMQLPNQNSLSENDLRVMDQHWSFEQTECESFVRYLFRTGWLTQEGDCDTQIVLTDEALTRLQQPIPSKRGKLRLVLATLAMKKFAFARLPTRWFGQEQDFCLKTPSDRPLRDAKNRPLTANRAETSDSTSQAD